MSETESVALGHGNENTVLDGLSQGPTHLGFPNGRDSAEQPVVDVSARSSGDPQEALGRIIEPLYASQQHVAQLV